MKNKTILIIASHPDDELLGCGGTVRQYVKKGARVVSVLLGQGVYARGKKSPTALKKLRADARKANRMLGIKDIYFENLPDNQFDSVSLLSIVKKVEKYIKQYQPDIILTHSAQDLNVDHRLTFEAVMTACRPQSEVKVPEIYCFEIPSSTDFNALSQNKVFVPNVFVDISAEIGEKMEALACYTSEMRPYPHARSLKGVRIMAQYRGVTVGLEYAEAFRLVRKIIKN